MERGALSPDAAVEADDGGGGELLTLNIAHEVIIDVGLPRHCSSFRCSSSRTEGFRQAREEAGG